MIYQLQPGQSYDAEILRQELVRAIGAEGWHLNTSGGSVEFIGEGFDPSTVILAHFDNGPAREANKAILKQIAELEAQVTDRRIREAVLGLDGGWIQTLNNQIVTLRSTLK